ncbi:hypothetical protein QSU92_01280 [Microbacterium sp. ET2]|uniref:hypothetical protein n=1 Tax=Microbacterium albipurpureum TaxID=3050384 RepID=UPI00259CDE66|nr:hypothetical protein [Microbacterium sp. ET2 (Ac-2212)]WJL95887.1 hypothetical protein QSU92_01280 [Microbacterium sp. ET2 (Ac-2212)]
MLDDLLVFATQPACRGCTSVLRDDPRGFECVTCGMVYQRDGRTLQRVVDAG